MAGPARRRRGDRPAPRKIEIRLDETEHALIRAAAGRRGRGVSLARFAAEATLTAAGATPPPSPVADRRRTPSRLALAEIADAAAEVSRIGNNLNQLAREYNATGHRPTGTATEVARALTALHHLADIAEAAADTG